MLHLLKLLIFGHVHDWETVKDNQLNMRGRGDAVVATGHRYILRCKKCGSMKKFDAI